MLTVCLGTRGEGVRERRRRKQATQMEPETRPLVEQSDHTDLVKARAHMAHKTMPNRRKLCPPNDKPQFSHPFCGQVRARDLQASLRVASDLCPWIPAACKQRPADRRPRERQAPSPRSQRGFTGATRHAESSPTPGAPGHSATTWPPALSSCFG
ncbi:hypothetical protein AAFF_G00053750 [Aldrovandia affinis]|uniref:Uncharacterized protein n=1 Tax=Aldrovandia affinis TaxID=143900 RepID=A0AAD7WEE4_9TELE|nr:hypothetical protein AAFF_G00053750 [Aldrovandia affinis]